MTDAFLSFNDSKTTFNNSVGIKKEPSSSVALDIDGITRVCRDLTVERPKILLNNMNTGNDIVSLESSQGSSGNGVFIINVRNDSSGTLEEKLRVNYAGALGISGSNFGSNGQVLVSKGSGSAAEWETLNTGSGSGGSVNFTNYSSGTIPAADASGSYVLAEGNLTLPAAQEGRYLTILTNSFSTATTGTFSEIEAYIASNTDDHLGRSVSINGNGSVIAIGTENTEQNSLIDCGDVKIYRKNSSGDYVLETTLTGEYKGQLFGWSMDMDSIGNRLVIHSYSTDSSSSGYPPSSKKYGFTEVYDYSSGSWTKTKTFLGEDVSTTYNNNKGYGRPAISKDGNTIMLSSWHATNLTNNFGYVQVFNYNGTNWVQKGSTFSGSSINDFYGSDIDVNSDGTRILIGYASAGSDDGELYVYTYNGSAWVQYGTTLSGANGGDEELGRSAKFNEDGQRIVIGSPLHDKDTNITNSGKIAVFSSPTSSSGNWTQLGTELNIEDLSDLSSGDRFGFFVDISDDGNTIAAASRKYLSNDGIVRIYTWSGSQWDKLQDITRPSGESGGLRGLCLSRDGSHIGLGFPSAHSGSTSNARVIIYSGPAASSFAKTITAASGEYINNRSDILINRYKHFVCTADGYWSCSPEPYYFSANLGENDQTVDDTFNIIQFIPSLSSPYNRNNSDMSLYKWTCPESGLYNVNVSLTFDELSISSPPNIYDVKIVLYLNDGTVDTPVLCSVQKHSNSKDYITLNLSGLVNCLSGNKLFVKGKIVVLSTAAGDAGVWVSKFTDGSVSLGYASVFNLTRVL